MDSILQRIVSCSKEYLARVPPSRPLTRHANESVLPVSLPEPPCVVPALVKVGAPIALAQELQRAYQQQATELKHRCETKAFQLAHVLSQYPGPSTSQSVEPVLFAAIEELYTTRLEDWLKDCLSRFKRRTLTNTGQVSHPRRSGGAHTTFNIEYVPLLEHFFEENPFPTYADKVRLAKKSGMTYRQIHVWFQNKRTRSRKERRKPISNRTCTFPIGSLCQQTKQCVKGHSIRTGRLLPRGQAMVSSDVQNPLDSPAAPHAFPSTYPPPPRYKPFPVNSTLQSRLLPWRRRSSSVRSPLPVATSMSDLVEMFSHLSVRDDHSHRQQMRSSSSEIGAAVSSITVKPFSAPLFATYKPVEFVTKAALVPLPTIPAPPTLLHPFRAPSPQARPVTLIPSNTPKKFKCGQKVAPLPERPPQISIGTKQNLTRSAPDYSNHRSPSSGSSVWSPSSELSPSVTTTPEVGSPSPLDEVSPVPDGCPIDQEDFDGLAVDSLSEELLLDSSSASNPAHSRISEISVSPGNSKVIMRVMCRAIPPRHARLPLCVGS